MDAHDRLHAARDAAKRGDHAHALEEHLWFHHHALEEEPSLAGVRLSYALSDWKNLAAIYPPARDALVGTRDAKVALLLRGEGGFDAFHDVTALNRYLDAERASYELLLQLRANHPRVAEDCRTLAWKVALQFGDITIAREYMRESADFLEGWQMLLNVDPALLAETPLPHERFLATNCTLIAEEVAKVVRVLRASGETADADSLPRRLLDAIQSPTVREQLATALAAAA